jgi:hypothetical protein
MKVSRQPKFCANTPPRSNDLVGVAGGNRRFLGREAAAVAHLLQVAAGAEGTPGAGQDDRGDAGVLVDLVANLHDCMQASTLEIALRDSGWFMVRIRMGPSRETSRNVDMALHSLGCGSHLSRFVRESQSQRLSIAWLLRRPRRPSMTIHIRDTSGCSLPCGASRHTLRFFRPATPRPGRIA